MQNTVDYLLLTYQSMVSVDKGFPGKTALIAIVNQRNNLWVEEKREIETCFFQAMK